ncbi:MAG: hypothetical protein DRH56_01620 [Deltaproteobacteria bacterium]|nr:MAG: hypothetical protein DRH56_01620 [Deltaproteobacteria bacterium]
MARLLFAWELGWQLSHLSNIEMIVRPLVGKGHEIAVAARELQGAHEFFSGIVLQYYQSPFKQGKGPVLSEYLSYAHLLYTSGYADPRELAVLLSAWFGIIGSFRPDVIVFDHSPTALLASRAFDVRRVLIGSGFLVPPTEPLLGILPDIPRTPEILKKLEADERIVLRTVNQAVSPYGLAPLSRLSDIYSPVDESFLLTFPELDPFGVRESADYYGVWPVGRTVKPEWPESGNRRIFAYVTAFPGCRTLLRELISTEAAVLVYAPGIEPEIRNEVAGDNLRFTEHLVNLDDVAADCDLFVSHGAHTSVARMLLKGVPQFMIPNYKEQLFTALRVKEMGAGLVCERDQDSYLDALRAVLDDGKFREGALRFSRRHRNFDAESSAAGVGMRLKAYLSC